MKENVEKINANIVQACKRSNRNPEEITIIGVTKYVTIERTKETLAAGVTNIGENRTEGFLEKYRHIEKQANWHFIGTLQSRKTRDVVNKVTAIHSLDRLSLAKEIQKRAEKTVDCFIQVNISGETSKHGIQPDQVHSFLHKLETFNKIRVIGLMTMAPYTNDEQEIRGVFSDLRMLRDEIIAENLSYAPCKYLSMGMSNDYEIAIEEGATHIRLGSKLVGP